MRSFIYIFIFTITLFLVTTQCSDKDIEGDDTTGDDDSSTYEDLAPHISNLTLDCGGPGSTGVEIAFDWTDADGDVEGGEVYVQYRFNGGPKEEAHLAVPEGVAGTEGHISVFLEATTDLVPGDKFDIQVQLVDMAGHRSIPAISQCSVSSI